MPIFGIPKFGNGSFIFTQKTDLYCVLHIVMAGKDGKSITKWCNKVGGKKKPLKQKKTERGPETEVSVYFVYFLIW